MKEETKRELRYTCARVIHDAWDEISEPDEFPWCGENIEELMGDAAANVLIALADSQEYLRREKMLKE